MEQIGYGIVPLADGSSNGEGRASHYDPTWEVPAHAARSLRRDNPRLAQLRQRYASLDWPVCAPSRWHGDVLGEAELDLVHFRGDNQYVWQNRDDERINELRQFLRLDDISRRDHVGLLDALDEDGAFGAFTFSYEGRPMVSRDLLDSVSELLFLDEQLGLLDRAGLRVLDIGAGYGRLAHRTSQAARDLASYTCVDAVAESTFLCEYYSEFRQLGAVHVVELPDVPALEPGSFDVAVNVHSFSECPIAAIEWWLDQLERLDVAQLFIVPNELDGFLSNEVDRRRHDYLPVLERHGYRLVSERHAHPDPAVRNLLGVHDRHCLFRRDVP